MTHTTGLAAKVAARNLAHVRLRSDAQALFAICRSFVGRKIRKVNGELTQAFREALAPYLKEGTGDHWLSSTYSLARVFKTCEQGPRTCYYATATLYIGEMDGQTLKSVEYGDKFDASQFRTDYTAEAVSELRAEVKRIRNELTTKESALSHFGEHDNS